MTPDRMASDRLSLLIELDNKTSRLTRRLHAGIQRTFHRSVSDRGIPDDNALDEGCRQAALPSPAPHNRYLRNVPQNPVEEDVERGLPNLGFAKGIFDPRRKKLLLKEMDSKKKRMPRLAPRIGVWF